MKTFVFDTETTNLIHNSAQPLEKQPRIIEFFGLILDDDFNELKTIHQYFKPDKLITKEITKITGITNEMVQDAPPFAIANEAIQQIIQSADRVVAHNLSYDISVTDFEFKRINKNVTWPTSRVCTVEATEHLKGYRLSLSALHSELFGETFTGAHRAENDVRALSRCYVELVKRGEI